jgi:Predicted outer membrane protein
MVEDMVPGTYTVTEASYERYVPQQTKTVEVVGGKTATVSFSNKLKKFNVTVKKVDRYKKVAQGDASLAGAVYGIYKGGNLVDTYTTDAKGQFTTAYYVCGDDWTVKEITPSEGYLINPEVYQVGADPKNYSKEYNPVSMEANETVQKGKIALIKHTDDGETKIETPEKGAGFVVFLRKSGSYEQAKEEERDHLICDEDGFAQTKELPYGWYTVRQTVGWEGRELMKDFDVFINKNEKTYRYLINNREFGAHVKIVKKDAETGKTIPYAGAGFQIYDPKGNLVTMTFTYPEITKIDTFYTAEDGMLITPEKLPHGEGYSLVEVQAPYGYVLDSEPVKFDVVQNKSEKEQEITIIKVERPNMPQKGKITVAKTGEVFSSVTATGGGYLDENGNDVAFPNLYQPVYADKGLEGAVYEIRAAEDIITTDGTVHCKKDEVVATITTGDDGTAVTEPLYFGKYEIREVTAPEGMLINDTVYEAELTYAGQEVAVTETEAEFYNERQKVEISLDKVLEGDERFEIGDNGEIQSVQFGLYAAEDITAADGTAIPKDGLLEIISCDEKGKAAFRTDVPVGAELYVKEYSTDVHYILSEETYPVEFEYAGQETALVKIRVNEGKEIENELIYGSVKGHKTDRETGENIAGAVFGLFSAKETEFTQETAILTAESDTNGVFGFENIPFGDWVIRELKPAEGFLPNSELYPVSIAGDGQMIEITVVNDRIPELGTTATVDGGKEINATEVFTLEDVVSYKHLIPGKEYVVNGVLMDKNTEKPLLIDGQEVHSEAVFTPEQPTGEVVVSFTFDAKFIKDDTSIVVFESLYKDGMELAVHADMEDENQTVKVRVPKLKTKATIDGKKKVEADKEITIVDTVTYQNLTPGKEYVVQGILMDKKTGKPYLADGKKVRTEAAFVPEKKNGKIELAFTFDGSGIKKDTEIVVFETLYRDGVELVAHADIKDKGQTVTIVPPAPVIPQTGDSSMTGLWLGLGAIALGGLISLFFIRKKKDEDYDS